MENLKKFKFIAMAMFVALLSMSFTACSDDDDDDQSVGGTSLVGTWTQSENNDGERVTLRFTKNGKGSVTFTKYHEDTNEIVSSSTQNFEYIYDSQEKELRIVDSQLDGDWDVTITNTRLIMENGYHKYILYKS